MFIIQLFMLPVMLKHVHVKANARTLERDRDGMKHIYAAMHLRLRTK
jgi:hypothetical protein